MVTKDITKKRKKILYIITKSNFGGAQRYLFDLATNIPRESHEVVVALGGTGERGATTGRLKELLDENGIRTIVIRNFMRDISLFKEVLAFFEIIQIIKKEKPNTLHSMSSKAGGLGACVGRLLHVKRIIFTSHGLAYDESWRPWWQRLLILVSSWWTFIFSTKSIQITKDTYERARNLPFMKNKMVLIHNGREKPAFLSHDEARMKLCANENVCGDIWIGTIAELTANKNLHALIDALHLIHKKGTRTHLWILGDGEERAHLERQITELSIEQYVHLPGYLPDASQYLKAFDIFTLPSKKEGLPYVLLEAGYASLPVVVSDIPGISDIITHEVDGLMLTPTPKKLQDAFLKLIDNKELREKYGAALHNSVDENFSIDRMVEQTLKQY